MDGINAGQARAKAFMDKIRANGPAFKNGEVDPVQMKLYEQLSQDPGSAVEATGVSDVPEPANPFTMQRYNFLKRLQKEGPGDVRMVPAMRSGASVDPLAKPVDGDLRPNPMQRHLYEEMNSGDPPVLAGNLPGGGVMSPDPLKTQDKPIQHDIYGNMIAAGIAGGVGGLVRTKMGGQFEGVMGLSNPVRTPVGSVAPTAESTLPGAITQTAPRIPWPTSASVRTKVLGPDDMPTRAMMQVFKDKTKPDWNPGVPLR